MAGTIVHHKIGNEVYKNINPNIDKKIFTLACQGHDLLYFIKLKDLPKFKQASLYVDILQDKKFSTLVKEYQKVILDNPNSIELKSFLYGYIIHHITDSIFHPYIIYMSGNYEGRHELMESIIDSLFTNNINTAYKEFSKIKDNSLLITKTEKVFYKVYGIKDLGKTLIKNMNNIKGFLWLYRTDKTGIKKFGYKVIDKVLKSNYTFLSYNYSKKERDIDIFKKVVWHNPIDNKKEYSSINDLYEKSIKESIKVVIKIDKSLENKKIAEINNISAVTGYICQNNYELKYFKD